MGKVYGGIGLAIVNPILGPSFAAVMHKLEKSEREREDAERAVKTAEERELFRNKFYARQKFATYEDYLNSSIWHEKRALVARRANGRCESEDCHKPLEEVHHKYYPRIWGKEEIDSLIGLCSDHHREAHGHTHA